MIPRGIRNNNPLNIEYSERNKWQGRVSRHKLTDQRFEQFRDAKWGIRAGAVLIINHYDKKGANTIRKLINIWAPKTENDTESYIKTVSELSGFAPDQLLCFHEWAHLKPVIKAMIFVENGVQPYSDELIDEALKLAGVVQSKPKSLRAAMRTDTGKGAISTGTIVATSLTAAAPVLSNVDWRIAIGIVIAITVTTIASVLVWRMRRD